ncbi:MAG: restriction endonuclease subunit S [Actinobacteria bacterium]|nr:restriction endonuclease subunit S [Actinomycetota bacterium]
MGEWIHTTLGDLLSQTGGSIKTGPFGTVLKAAEYSTAGVPVISVGEVGVGSLRVDERTPRVSEAITTRLPEYVLRHGDIVFGRKGAVDRSAWVREQEDGYFLGSDGIRVRVDDGVSSRFMSYQFRSDATRTWLGQHASGTTMLSLSQAVLERVPVIVPGLQGQLAIAAVLGCFDDKIAANERLIGRADELSWALWFEALTRGLSVRLSSLAEFVNGRAFTKGASGTGRVVVRIAELNSGIGSSTVRSDIDVPDENLARPGDLLFAWSGSLTVARWYRPEAIVNQHIFKVIPRLGYPMWLVNQAVRSKLADFKAIASGKATTMGHIQRRHLDEFVLIPRPEAVAALDSRMSALWSAALSAEMENLKLARTRDELLPLLMSGKVSVTDAEAIAEGAV